MPKHLIDADQLDTVIVAVAAITVPDISGSTVVLADATTAAFAITLPAAVAGRIVVVKKTDASANAVTVTPAAGTIDGAANRALATQYDYVRLVSDGTNWFEV